MIEYFISKNRFLKLSLLEILSTDELNISLFSNEHNISKYTVKRYLKELQLEVAEYGFNCELVFPNSETCMLNNRKSDLPSLNKESVEKIKYEYLSTYSPSFLLCELLCMGERFNLSKIEEHLRLSTSQIYKIINDFNESVASHTISIAFNKDGTLDFFGDELDIRIFIYNFILTCIPKKKWFFKNTSKHQIYTDIMSFEEFNTVSKYTIDKLCTFFGILQTRLLLKKYLSPIEQKYQSSFARFSYLKLSSLKYYFSDKRLTNEMIQYTEYLHFNFFLRVFIPDAIPETNILEIGNYLQKSANSDHRFLNSFLVAWGKKFDIKLSEANLPVLLYNSAILSIFSFFIPNNISQFWNNNNTFLKDDEINVNLFAKVVNFVTNFVDNYPLPPNKKIFLQENGIPYFSSLYYLETVMFLHPNITIYMYFTTEYTSEVLLKNRIEQIYNPEIIQFVSQAEAANIILTDSNENYPPDSKVILVNGSLTTKNLNFILETVHIHIIKKLLN
ncbi:helix-turn-helix domain-containing protein [Enterococcus faecalis]